MLWPTVSAVGFLAATALVVVLARARTSPWEERRRQRPAPPPPEPEEPPGRLARVRTAVTSHAGPVARVAARVRPVPVQALHAGGARVRALRARVHSTGSGDAPAPAGRRGLHLPAVHVGPAGVRLPLQDRLRRRRARRADAEARVGAGAGDAAVLLPQDADGPEVPVGDGADPAAQP
jgi:hypothetical protein